mmetsp:Transcript_5415/g.9029  ORF Transcript_5415/g.9029 Transcript_5415/m.9029 type:complete len:537 (+) Transcript_5415:64-1674(+)
MSTNTRRSARLKSKSSSTSTTTKTSTTTTSLSKKRKTPSKPKKVVKKTKTMGNNMCKKLGVAKNSEPISRKQFDALWQAYSHGKPTIAYENARAFAKDFAAVCNFTYLDPSNSKNKEEFVDNIMKEAGLTDKKAKVSKRQFVKLFVESVDNADADMTQSLIGFTDAFEKSEDEESDNDETTTSSSTIVSKSAPADVTAPSTAAPSPPKENGWYYTDENNKWVKYDGVTTRLLQGSLQAGQITCALNHGDWAKVKETKEKSKGEAKPAVTGARVDFGLLYHIDRRTGQAAHVCCVPKPTQKSYGAGGDAYAKLTKSIEGSSGFGGPSAKEVKKMAALTAWKKITKPPEDDDCAICMCGLADEGDPGDFVVQLSKCSGHMFHRDCVIACAKDEWIQCPICLAIYGVRTGPMPKGTMNVSRNKNKLPGQSGGTIIIKYNFPNGIQDSRHPSPGTPYTGTSRTAYLPDNKEGNHVLKLLQTAFDRKLTFQVGTSVTNGTPNTVVWAGIHHKTSTGAGAFGYPDATYLSRVQEELAAVGVQ